MGNGSGFERISPLPVAAGDSGLNSLYEKNSLLCSGSSATSPFETLTSGQTGQFLTSNGPGMLPTWMDFL